MQLSQEIFRFYLIINLNLFKLEMFVNYLFFFQFL